MSGRFAGERAVVVGAAVAGSAVATALAAEGADVLVTERSAEAAIPAAGSLRGLGVDLRAGGHRPEHLDGATVVVASPGVPPDSEVLRWAAARGLPVWGELEVGARLAEVPCVAVTGTNGKTTATGMIEACLRAAGMDAVACGNIGRSFPLAARERHDVLVVECSSFQLALHDSFRPRVSTLLNLAPDHLDWHGTFDGYAAAKARIFLRQSAGDVHVGNRDDAAAARISAEAPCERRWFTEGSPDAGVVGFDEDELVARVDGEHRLGPVPATRAGFRSNAAAAAACVIAFGASADAVRAGLDGFEPPAHRGDVVAEVDGVRFIDDSKATNVHAALAAIGGVRDGVLIAGGRAKGVDLSPLADRADRLRAVVAIGEAGPELVRIFEPRLPVSTAGSIEEAVAIAFGLARGGGTVLLAPACASWDQFRDYRERGERFAAAARALRGADVRG